MTANNYQAQDGDFILFHSEGYWMAGIVDAVSCGGNVISASIPDGFTGNGGPRSVKETGLWRSYPISGKRYVCRPNKFCLPLEEIVSAAPIWESRELASTWLERLRAEKVQS
jgi:hypothetical protein